MCYGFHQLAERIERREVSLGQAAGHRHVSLSSMWANYLTLMAFTRHFFKAHHFVYTQCVGIVDDNDLRIHVLSFQVESKGMEYVREVLDFRQLQRADRLTVQGIIEISELERERSQDRDFRLALLVDNPLHAQIAKIYGYVLTTENLTASVFEDDTKKALHWLGYETPIAQRLSAFMSRHFKQASLR